LYGPRGCRGAIVFLAMRCVEIEEQNMKTGSPYPIGASVTTTGVNFSVFSYHATRAELLLFDTDRDAGSSPTSRRTRYPELSVSAMAIRQLRSHPVISGWATTHSERPHVDNASWRMTRPE
jgi:pullulanase/glycogen debranching enzyme